jgi:signal transduction histidine kinase
MLVRSILEGDSEHRLARDVVERLHVVRQAAEQIDALIQDLLDVSRLEAGRLAVSLERVDVNWLLSRSVEAMRPLAEASGVSLRLDVPADLPSLRADPDRARQVLSNVIGNAIKFTRAGGGVRIGVGLADGSMLFTVSDTGIGVPPEQLPHVFDRYFQVSATAGRGTRHGAGLGLPISRGIVEAHGGRIWMESDPATGTMVRFTLPVR